MPQASSDGHKQAPSRPLKLNKSSAPGAKPPQPTKQGSKPGSQQAPQGQSSPKQPQQAPRAKSGLQQPGKSGPKTTKPNLSQPSKQAQPGKDSQNPTSKAASPQLKQKQPSAKQTQPRQPGSNQPSAKQTQPGKPNPKQPGSKQAQPGKPGPKQPGSKQSKPGQSQTQSGKSKQPQKSPLELAFNDLHRALKENPELRADLKRCEQYIACIDMPIPSLMRARIVVLASTARTVKELKAQTFAPKNFIVQWLRAFIKRGYDGLHLSTKNAPQNDLLGGDQFKRRLQGVMRKLR